MNYIGIDLHKRTVVVSIQDEQGNGIHNQTFPCTEPKTIVDCLQNYIPFQAVIEASSSYRWLYDLLDPLGNVVLAHPLRLKAIVSGRAKTDKLDANLLAKLLRANLIPTSYIPPYHYQELRELTRARARLVRRMVEAKNELSTLVSRLNVHSPYKILHCKSSHRWLQQTHLGTVENSIRDELLLRIQHYEVELQKFDEKLNELTQFFPQLESLLDLHGVGVYTALLIIGEIGEPDRFPHARKVGAYAGLTARVNQSGDHCYYGHISRQGSSWLRWALVLAAMKVIKKDQRLHNFYTRIRKRSSSKIARVAVARKLAEICWIRLKRWHECHVV